MGVEDLLSHPLLWRGQHSGSAGQTAGTATIATGFPALDRYLPGGGWPLTGITEIFVEHYGLGELRLLMPALARLSQHAVKARPWIVWIAPPFVPYAPALAHHGIELNRILLVHPDATKSAVTMSPAMRAPMTKRAARQQSDAETKEALWAVEQVIRSQSSVAAFAWVREADVTALRRLQLGAEACRCWTVLFRPMAAMGQSSPAALRFRLSSVATAIRSAEGRAGDEAGIRIEIQKCRGRRPRSFTL